MRETKVSNILRTAVSGKLEHADRGLSDHAGLDIIMRQKEDFALTV